MLHEAIVALHIVIRSMISMSNTFNTTLAASGLLYFGRVVAMHIKITGALHAAFGKVLSYSNLPTV